MMLRCLWLIVGLVLSLSVRASEREESFPSWSQSDLVPWFNSQEDQFLLARAPSPKPVRLRYKSFLQKQAKGQVVIVHGYGERIEKHMEMGYDFYQAGYNVFMLDQRGFGRSTRLNPDDRKAIYVEHFADYVEDLHQFFTEVVQPGRTQLPNMIFAHSMGGLVSTLLIHDHPELVQAAVFSAPMLSLKTRGVPQVIARLVSEIADSLNFGAEYAFGQTEPVYPAFEIAGTQSRNRWKLYADIYSSEQEWPLALGGASFHWLGEALRGTQVVDSDSWTATISTPILLFQADNDTYVDNQGQDRFCLRVKDCRKIAVPGTRHEIYREQDVARGPYMLSLLQFFEEQTNAPGRNSATPASQIRTE